MKHFIFLLLLPVFLCGQTTGEYLDVVELKKGKKFTGTLIGYVYGESVSLVREDGELIELEWSDLRRVGFKLDQERLAAVEKEQPLRMPLIDLPARKWRHQLAGSIYLSSTNENRFGFEEELTNVGIGISYHFVRELGALKLGVGPEVDLMSRRRRETLLSATALVEYQFGNGKLRPFLRGVGGIAFPLGANDFLLIEERRPGFLFHPSVGVELIPPAGRWGGLAFDAGYRLARVGFSATTSSFDFIERRISYRRATLKVSTRF